MTDPSLSEGDPLNDLAEDFLGRYRRGECPDLSEYTARHPELAARIRELFPAVVLMERLGLRKEAAVPAVEPPAPRQLGEYRLVREVGRGGMGIVYEAVQESLGRRVAVKVLSPSLRHGKYLERFRREARAAAKLHHTNIVPVFGVGEQDGQPYYVMQFIDGHGLDAALEAFKVHRDPASGTTAPGVEGDSKLPVFASSETKASASVPTVPARPRGGGGLPAAPSEAAYFRSVARLGVQAAEALAYAHGQGVLHRDIKPSNLLLDAYGRLWVADFGLAKAGDSADLTEPGDMVGTLRYLAPERFQGRCDARADVYSLGVTLYELLIRRPAFDAADRARLLEQIAGHLVTPPRRLLPAVPRDLETIVLKAMAHEPADRYATADTLAEDLRRFLDDRPIHARRPTLGQKARKWGRRNKGIVWTALTAAVVLLLTVTLVAALAAVRLDKARHVAEDRAGQLQQDLESLKAANNWIEAGWNHTFQRQWRQAEADFAQAARRRPDLALAWTERCDLHLRLGLWDRAADDSLQALQIQEPTLPWFWYRHALLRLYVGDRQGYRRACAHMVERFGQTTDRELSYEVAHSCLLVPDPVVDPERLLGFAERGMGRRHEVWHLATLGAAHYRAGRYERATQILYDAFHVDPHWPGRALIHAMLAMAWHRQGHAGDTRFQLQCAARAIDDLTQEMLRNEVGAMHHTWWIDLLGSLVLYREAKMLIDGWVLPDDPKLHLARARALALLHEKDTAAAACARAVEIGSSNAALRLECGLVYGDLGRWDKALPLLSKAGELAEADAKLGWWWFPLAIAHGQAGDKEQARQWYDRAAQWMVNHQPRDAKLRRFRAEAAALLGVQDHRPFPGHTAQVRSVVFSPDGSRALSASHDGTLRLWDVAGGKDLRCLRGHYAQVWGAALSPDGRRALSGGSDRTMRLWDVETGKELRRFRDPDGWVMSVAFSPDGRRALSGSFRALYLWDLESGQEQARWDGHADWVRAVAFSRDGRQALSGSHDKTVRLWDAATGKELRRFTGQELVLSVAFSPDGKKALSGGCDQTVRLWDLAGGKELHCFRGHQGNVESVAFSPDGRRVLSGSADGTIRLWDLPTGRGVYGFGTEEVLGVAFSPDGRQVLSAHADNLLRLWHLPEEPTATAADGNSAAR